MIRVRINSEKMVRELMFLFYGHFKEFQGNFTNWKLQNGSTAIFKHASQKTMSETRKEI
jgi:hypothetical protein